jgi:hypothetical protein
MRIAGMAVVAVAIVGGVMAPRASAMVGPTAEAGANDEQHQADGNARMDEGDAHQAAGAHAEAARAYTKAFDAFAQRAQSDAKEKQAVSLAVDEFRLAQDAEPRSSVLLEEEAALLARFVARTQDDGALLEERLRVKERMEALKAEETETKPREQEQTEDIERRPEPEPDGRSRRQAVAIVASGVVGILGGAAMVGAGAWTFGAADERRDAQLAMYDADEYPDEDGLREDLDQWYRRGRGIGTGLVVSGAVLSAAGIGLTAWGIVKMRRAGKRPSARVEGVLPMVGPDGVGVVGRVVF